MAKFKRLKQSGGEEVDVIIDTVVQCNGTQITP